MALIKRDYTGWVLLLIALGLGGGSFFLIRQYLGDEEARLRAEALDAQGSMVRVVVASKNLDAGSVISPANMSMGELPSRHISPRMIKPGDFKQVENRVLSQSLSAGEPLIADFVTGLVVNRFSDLLAKGTRAISIEVSALESHSGLLIPGDYIDLFAQVPTEDDPKERQLLGLFERVKILAAGQIPLRSAEQDYQHLPDRSGSYSLITVGLPIEDAENLLRARRLGEIVYLLRSAGDEYLYFADSGLPLFGEEVGSEAEPPGYEYFSVSVPRGERRQNPTAGELLPDNIYDQTLADERTYDALEDPDRRAYLMQQIMAPAQPRDTDSMLSTNE